MLEQQEKEVGPLTVYMAGTKHRYDDPKRFFKHLMGGTKGPVLGFDGPGAKAKKGKSGVIVRGRGLAFGSSNSQLENQLEEILNKCKETGCKVVNFVAHSRGAVNSIALSNLIAERSKKEEWIKGIEVNIAAIDPVAGAARKKEKKFSTVPGSVKNMMVFLAEETNRGFVKRSFKGVLEGFKGKAFAQQDLSRIVFEDPGATHLQCLHIKGGHGDALCDKKEGLRATARGKVVAVSHMTHALIRNFLCKLGTEFNGKSNSSLVVPERESGSEKIVGKNNPILDAAGGVDHDMLKIAMDAHLTLPEDPDQILNLSDTIREQVHKNLKEAIADICKACIEGTIGGSKKVAKNILQELKKSKVDFVDLADKAVQETKHQSELHKAFCLLQDGNLVPIRRLGRLDNAKINLEQYEKSKNLFQRIKSKLKQVGGYVRARGWFFSKKKQLKKEGESADNSSFEP